MEESATTAALIGLLLALTEVAKRTMAKANGGSIEYRVAQLEKSIESLTARIADFSKAFYVFREETRIHQARMSERRED
jgi:mannose/fructose/N-acetylgalactosamine-specific phosphotransferase system component IIB